MATHLRFFSHFYKVTIKVTFCLTPCVFYIFTKGSNFVTSYLFPACFATIFIKGNDLVTSCLLPGMISPLQNVVYTFKNDFATVKQILSFQSRPAFGNTAIMNLVECT